MRRPDVSVVMPFAGTRLEAAAAQVTLGRLERSPGDELILADNTGTAVPEPGVTVVRAAGEQSPAHARNIGAAHARGMWILFLDGDCTAPPDLLDRYFAPPPGNDVGALAGAVAAVPGATGIAERYGAAKNFLDQGIHLAHAYLPRAVAANLLVRREAFAAVGGFFEGVRAAEDTDFSWRLQRAGWRLESRPAAGVEHRYRRTVRDLRRQWRGYAAGRAWLGRRYDGFSPEPALVRAAHRALHRPPGAGAPVSPPRERAAAPVPGRLDRARFLALDAVLGCEELAGFALSNRPPRHPRVGGGDIRVVLVADRFPAAGDPLADYASRLAGARVEAAARPEAPDTTTTLAVDYREDDGLAARAVALARLTWRHPLRCALDRVRPRGGPGLAAIAPAVIRLGRDREARLRPLGGAQPRAVAHRMAALTGRSLES